MTQPYTGAVQLKTRTALVLFIKGGSAPVALYTDNPQKDYEEIQKLVKTGSTTCFEKSDLQGPVKRITIAANQISAVALQEEQYA